MKANKIISIICTFFCTCIFIQGCCKSANTSKSSTLRLLYWNIQNGMWDGQSDNYDRFVEWVCDKEPDICVWCEAQTIYLTGTKDPMPKEDRYLVENWGELAKRYGHDYVYIGGHRDNYPQAITSKFPIENVERILGAEPDSVVAHGCGWAKIEINGIPINIVTLHTWPQAYAYRAANQDSSRAVHGGDKYRRTEMEYVCKHTILSVPDAANQMWMFMGDFNSRSRLDNYFYRYPEDDTRFLTQDYILQNTPYIDVIAEKYPQQFMTTTHGESRIDFVYCTKPLYDCITHAEIIMDNYVRPIYDAPTQTNFYHPSDHLPIIVDFDIR